MFKKILHIFKKAESLNSSSASADEDISSDGWYQPQPARVLLNTPLRQQYLKTIWQNVSMSPDMFEKLYQHPIEKYAEIVQLLPASESHHHSHIGGMLDHGLEVISVASKLRQNYVLPQNAAPEEQAKQRDIWTAVIIYSALLHDIGKVATDIEIQLKSNSRWFPWQGIPKEPYKFRYIKARDYNLHPILGSLLAHYLLPKEAFDWIAMFYQAFSSFTYFIAGHHDRAGIISEIIQKADQISVTMALGGDPSKLSEKPQISFAKQLHIALCHVVKNFKLNAPQGGSDGWLTDSGLWLMSKSTADNIRTYLISQGISVPSQNGKLFDELQAHNLIEKTQSGTAIWNGRPISHTGWAPAKPFTLLKISPNIIWGNIDDRPAYFDGRLEIETEHNNEQQYGNTPLSTHIASLITSELKPNSTIQEIKTEAILNISAESELKTTDEMMCTVAEITENNSTPEKNSTATDLDFILDLFPVNDDIVASSSEKQTLPNNLDKKIENQKSTKVDTQTNTIKDIQVIENTNDYINVEKFIRWMKASIISGKLNYNRPNAKLHIVNNHLFIVTPSIFQIYLGEAGITDKASWELLQKQFQNLGIHKRQHTENDSRNIWTCSIVGPNKKSSLSGYLLAEPERFLGDKLIINNQWLTLEGNLP